MVFPADERSPRILVVDDDRGAAQLIRVMLEVCDYSVTLAHSGAKAIDIIEEMAERASPWRPLPIDLILLDIMMPGVDGLKVCQRVKHDPLLRHIPVIMVTALNEASDKVAAVEFGADDYITKPFMPAELGATVKAKLQVKRREEALLRRNTELTAINVVSAAATSTLDPNRVASEGLAALMENTDLAAAAIYRYDETQDLLRCVIQQGVARPETLPVEGLAQQVFRAQHPVHKADLKDDAELPLGSLGDTDLGAFVGVPLRAIEQSLGVLEVYHRQTYGFEEQDLQFYADIGDRIGAALQNAEIFQRAQTLLLKLSPTGVESSQKS